MTPKYELLHKTFEHIKNNPQDWDQCSTFASTEQTGPRCFIASAYLLSGEHCNGFTTTRDMANFLGVDWKTVFALFRGNNSLQMIEDILTGIDGYKEYVAALSKGSSMVPKFKVGQTVFVKNYEAAHEIRSIHIFADQIQYGFENLFNCNEDELKAMPEPLTAKEAVNLWFEHAGTEEESMQFVLDTAKERGIA